MRAERESRGVAADGQQSPGVEWSEGNKKFIKYKFSFGLCEKERDALGRIVWYHIDTKTDGRLCRKR